MLEKLSVKWENIQIFPNFIYKKEKEIAHLRSSTHFNLLCHKKSYI